MPVLGLVTCRAVQEGFFRAKVSIRRLRVAAALLEPEFDVRRVRLRLRRLVLELLETDARERDVIHFRGAWDSSLMFQMTRGARRDVSVKGSRLALKDGFVAGMANDAVLRFDAFQRRVAGSAVIFEKSVPLRQVAGNDHVPPGGGQENRARCFFSMSRGERKET